MATSDHWHECRDCGAQIAGGGETCTQTDDFDCTWEGGNAGCTSEECKMPTPLYETLRAMKGRGHPVTPAGLDVGDVVRVDGVKYRVQSAPNRQPVTGSIAVEAYSEDNQHDTLFLSPSGKVPVIGRLT